MNERCQVFTPHKSAIELLDYVDYKENLYGLKVMENACGDGNILREIVNRYIKDALANGMDKKKIKKGLENDIYGVEIDKYHSDNCHINLDKVSKEFGITNVKWNIAENDFLKMDITEEFDYVISNPPYITYRDLETNSRAALKAKFESCKNGKFDYCYAFIEASLISLKKGGKLGYLIPNSIFKNVFGRNLRNVILPHTTKIKDYTTKKLFENAQTSSAMLVCEKDTNYTEMKYHDVIKKKEYIIEKQNLGEKWIFNEVKLKKAEDTKKKRFGDYFHAAISIATLYNAAYVLDNYEQKDDYIIVDNYKIEEAVIRKTVSPRSLNYNQSKLIVFPYEYEGDNLIRYSADEFEANFPKATEYLKSHAEKLKNRKSDKSTYWFEYGRTQALAHLNQPKLLLSTVVTKKVRVYELEQSIIPYSGIYIIAKSNLSLKEAKKILTSKKFYEHISKIGINANGKSFRITAKDINDYEF